MEESELIELMRKGLAAGFDCVCLKPGNVCHCTKTGNLSKMVAFLKPELDRLYSRRIKEGKIFETTKEGEGRSWLIT